MPHRTTYFFPRQFPDRRFDVSSKQPDHQDHEIKKLIPTNSTTSSSSSTTTTKDAFSIENDKSFSSSATKNLFTVNTTTTKASAVSDLFTSHDKSSQTKQKLHNQQHNNKQQQQQNFAAFCDWLAEKKAERRSTSHLANLSRYSCDEDRELLLPPESAVQAPEEVAAPPPQKPPETRSVVKDRSTDRNFDRQVSLPRVSSGSSYAGSLFSGITTLDGTLSGDVKDCLSKVSSSSRQDHDDHEVEEVDDHERRGGGNAIREGSTASVAQRSKESYYLQLSLAKRLTSQACLASEPLLMQLSGPETSDAETVSYRLWVPLFFFFLGYDF